LHLAGTLAVGDNGHITLDVRPVDHQLGPVARLDA
jgi:hypothetical protein